MSSSSSSSSICRKKRIVTSSTVPSFTIFDNMAVNSTPITNTPIIINNKNNNISSNINNENNPNDMITNSNNRKRDSNTNTISETKKLKISQQEREMSGAPEGELYDVTLLQDDDITPYEPSDNVINELSLLVSKSGLYATTTNDKTGTWADKYALVEFIRRVLLHHTDNLSIEFQHHHQQQHHQQQQQQQQQQQHDNDIETPLMITITDASVDAIQSLRSSTVRNGILCARAIINSYSRLQWSDSQLMRIVTDLINRTTVGPRFICEQAGEVLTTMITVLPLLMSILLLIPSINHKNADACSKVFSLIAESTLKLTEIVYQPPSLLPSPCIISKLVDALSKGLNAKRPQARDLCRKAFRHIQVTMGNEAFQTMINGLLISHKAIEVNREIESLTKSESSLVSVFTMPTDKKFTKSTTTTNTTTIKSSTQSKSFKDKRKENGVVCSVVTNSNENAFDIMEI